MMEGLRRSIPTKSAPLAVAEAAVLKTTPTWPAWRKAVLPCRPTGLAMREAGASTPILACPITGVEEVVARVGRVARWWKIREDGAESVVMGFIFLSLSPLATTVGSPEEGVESFMLTDTRPTTVVAEVVEEAGGPVRPPSMARPARPTQVEVEEAADIKFRVSPVAPVSW